MIKKKEGLGGFEKKMRWGRFTQRTRINRERRKPETGRETKGQGENDRRELDFLTYDPSMRRTYTDNIYRFHEVMRDGIERLKGAYREFLRKR